ncbi:transcriptional regulator [Lactococcus cremoris]|uniref:Transcriptional regulator, CodY family n=2 Tax=Lactococcus lactis subsp. cremoris TaxID=1359 RepID=A0A084AD08_LACLC|nr:transcriptional regulator [Lactococcus cremoris]KEY63187.1 Transcriptional regulator, CodY family [Lactococcus cremoris subsp. cremoris GE214]KKW70291.1 GTP-sensing transcriptional pleiotropic repressor CodY, codY [Lactococcus cremoris]
MKEIYDKIKEINVTLKRSFIDLEKSLPYQDVAEKSAKILECTLFMIDTKRNFLGYGFSEKFYQSDMNLQNFFTYQKISKELSTEILNQYEMSESEQMTHSILKSVKELSGKFANQYLTLIPIEANHLRLGTVFLLTDAPLNQEEAILADFLLTFIGNQMSSNVLYYAVRAGNQTAK